MTDARSLQKLSRNFVIPAGTQVVLTAVKKVISAAEEVLEEHAFRKPGSVGVVIRCPPHSEQPYLIQFTDGLTVSATFDELALR